MYSCRYNDKARCVTVFKNSAEWFSIPASVCINNTVYAPACTENNEQQLVFSENGQCLTFTLHPDAIEVTFAATFTEDTPVFEASYFKNEKGGMQISHFDRAFCPQPRRNDLHNMDFYKNLPDCSLTGYFSPTILNFSIGDARGWVSFGLLDLPDSTLFKLDEDFSVLVESCGGNKVIKAGGTYRLPTMLITFPEDEWQGISLFRQKLIDFGRYTPRKPQFSEVPQWWRDPLICTYGDELATLKLPDVDMIDPQFNADWVRMLVDTAEQKWGIKHMNIVLDAFWQIRFALDPKVDETRFGNMRDFTDEMHARGHHVIAWITPMFDSVANGFEPRSKRLNVLSKRAFAPLDVEGCYSLDFTSDNITQYFEEVTQVLFGDGEGEYNLDGVKMDYMANQLRPHLHSGYAHPEKGLGIRELKLFYEAFYAAAKKAKPDALVNCSTADPRFEHLIDINRLHDTHAGTIEKELRARVSTLACPNLLIDSDGALMFTDWAKHHYICAALYAVPSNYYTLQYHDKALDAADVPCMGTLLQMATLKPDGRAVMQSIGNWQLVDLNGQINGCTVNGHTLVFYPWAKNDKGYLFTWQNETVILPLFGRKFGKLSPAVEGYQVDYARDCVLIRLKPGVLYTFESVDEGNSIDGLFRRRAAQTVADVEYAN